MQYFQTLLDTYGQKEDLLTSVPIPMGHYSFSVLFVCKGKWLLEQLWEEEGIRGCISLYQRTAVVVNRPSFLRTSLSELLNINITSIAGLIFN